MAFYDEFLRLVRRHLDQAPAPGQTPGEFATAVATLMSDRGLDHVPQRLVNCYYRERYSGRPLPMTERAEIAQLLKELRARLTQAPRPQPA